MKFESVCGFCGDAWCGGWGLSLPHQNIDLKFCGRSCFRAWEAKMSFSHFEVEAIEKMLPVMGQYVAESGIGTKAFNDCSRDEILGLFANTVKTFRTEFQEVIEREGIPF